MMIWPTNPRRLLGRSIIPSGVARQHGRGAIVSGPVHPPGGVERRPHRPRGTESQHFYLAEDHCDGRITGRFRGANHPRRRPDGTFLPDCQGVTETDDGAVILFDIRGFVRAYPVGRRQIVGSVTHLTEDERYRWLNDVVCVSVGEVRVLEGGTEQHGDDSTTVRPTLVELVVDVAELMWEPIPE